MTKHGSRLFKQSRIICQDYSFMRIMHDSSLRKIIELGQHVKEMTKNKINKNNTSLNDLNFEMKLARQSKKRVIRKRNYCSHNFPRARKIFEWNTEQEKECDHKKYIYSAHAAGQGSRDQFRVPHILGYQANGAISIFCR